MKTTDLVARYRELQAHVRGEHCRVSEEARAAVIAEMVQIVDAMTTEEFGEIMADHEEARAR